jgi:excisionase family DNA binding protein
MKSKFNEDQSSKKKTPRPGSSERSTEPDSNGILSAPTRDVLILSEAAEFLRTDEDNLRSLAEVGRLPGRMIGSEWRFLRSALCAWLSRPEPATEASQRDRIIATFGSMSDDETALPMLKQIYEERRKHPVSELQG